MPTRNCLWVKFWISRNLILRYQPDILNALETDSCSTPLAVAARAGKTEMVAVAMSKSLI